MVHEWKKIPAKSKDLYYEGSRPCGSCIECRLKRSAWLATRCVHEASMHEENSFLTLTYSDDHMPDDRSLSTDTIQKFWKKMRKHISKRSGRLIKHYTSGEYGDADGERIRYSYHLNKMVGDNPHYHACLFGFDFPDKEYYKKTETGDILYTSKILTEKWGLGHAVIGDVSFESAAYVARYTLKKVYGDDGHEHYDGRLPEKSWCSQGLGESWFLKYKTDVYPSDEVILYGGRKLSPPPYYDKLLLKYDPSLYADIENSRAGKINKKINNFSLERFYENGKPVTRTVSDVVRRAQIRVGSLDKNR